MDLSLQQLRGFVAVAEEQHFGRAAQRLNLTQPPLTRQIQGLERTLDVSLFDRTGRGVRLTAAGEVFLEHCRRVLALLEVAPEATRRAADGQTGTLRIAFTAIGAYAVLADFLTMVSKRTPAVTSELTELVSPDQFEALANLEIDSGWCGRRSRISSIRCWCIRRTWCSPYRPITCWRRVKALCRLADVTDDYIGYSPEGSQYLHDICAAMIGMNRYAVSQLASQVPTMLALVRAGLGCALIPRSIMAMGVQGVRYRELDAADAHSVTLHAALESGQPEPRASTAGRIPQGEPASRRLT